MGLLRQQPCGQHYAGVGGISAGCDRGDNHITVTDGPYIGRCCLQNYRLAGGKMSLAERHLALRQFRSRKTCLHRADIEINRFRINPLHAIVAPQPLRLAVGFDQRCLFTTTGQVEKCDCFRIGRKIPDACPVFWRHIRKGRALR